MLTFSAYIEGIERAMLATRAVEQTITPGSGGELDATVQRAAFALMIAAAGHSPVWFGVLRAAHRAEADGAKGRVFIAKGITHPVLGGHPDQYGVEVHQRKPWFTWTIEQDAPAILENERVKLEAAVVAEWGR